MPKLTSIILAKNEAHNIARCLESQLNIIDEIIVLLDSSTTDNTEAIVKKYSDVKCINVTWQGYSLTKQIGIEAAQNDWLFWIDADEELTDELKTEMLNFKNSAPMYDIYNVPRKAFFMGKWIKHCGWYPGRVNRIFNRNKVKMSDSSVHEHLIFSGKVGEFSSALNHYTDPNIEHYYDKFNRYTSLAADEMFKKGKSVSKFSILLHSFSIFLKMYIFKGGILDGFHGLILCIFSANYIFVKYCKLWELERNRVV